ncbi:competence protein ComEC [Sphaerochaeta associata]|jgi:competence protein ComEC|uniref:Hydrolase n=1 Tax=Sphaerochaeta associata TaxID=1129264 RepID=A0ABY4D962_9SPIR|nr:MBL fold metallo-hydrolase [Sphaerochaeta associata]UOM50735.1 hydrolase [Sphaerochaeta associata]SMP39336.1 competence protein ComEC [Sphaerochaeta associata]
MMEVIFINVGYGDAILVKLGLQYGLIDGGSSLPQEFVGNRVSLQEFLRKEQVSTLEFVLITHIHEDHVCGIVEILHQVHIKRFFLPYLPHISDSKDVVIGSDVPFNLFAYVKAFNAYKTILSYAKDNTIPCIDVMQFQSFHPVGSALEVRVLEPTDNKTQAYTKALEVLVDEKDQLKKLQQVKRLDAISNDHSLVLALRYEGFTFILPADNCPKNWREKTFSLLKNGNVLKLPHHGQKDSIESKLLENLRIQYVITSSSSDRRNNSSNADVYNQLQQVNPAIQFLFTDETEYSPYFSRPHKASDAIRFIVAEYKLDVKM